MTNYIASTGILAYIGVNNKKIPYVVIKLTNWHSSVTSGNGYLPRTLRRK